MTAANSNSQQVLSGEILADARKQAERAVTRARREADEAVAKSRADAEKDRADRLEAARAESVRRRGLALATVPVEVGRMRANRVEAILASIRNDVCGRLDARQGFDPRAVATALAAAAIAGMTGTQFVLELSDADRQSFGAALVEDVRRRVARDGLQVSLAPAGSRLAGGVVVRTADGNQMWDNSLAGRLERFWPALRREIGVRTALAGPSAATKES